MINKHFNLIKSRCEVISTIRDEAIFYKDGKNKYCEMLDEDGEWGTWECKNLKEFYEIAQMNGIER